MPSKISKNARLATRLWKSEQNCAEPRVLQLARELAPVISPGDRIFLEGEMGAGKTTFARSFLSALGVAQPAEGSPSFAIAHEYQSPRADVVHIDFYRLRNEAEIQDAGVDTYFWERPLSIIICEWISLFPELEASIRKTQSVWLVKLENKGALGDVRNIEIKRPVFAEQAFRK